METSETYRPANIEFNVDGGAIPLNIGFEFKEQPDAALFVAQHLVGINSKAVVSRFMDNFEKSEIRKEYQEILEMKLPILEREMMKAMQEFTEAKKKLDDAKEYVSAATNETKALAVEVKRGLKEMELDDMNTWRVPIDGKYYFYTFMDNQIKLAKVLDIPPYEKTELFNATTHNESFFKDYYPDGFMDDKKFMELKELSEKKI